MQTLESLLGELADSVLDDPDNEEYIFSARNLPEPLPELVCDRLIVEKRKNSYHGYNQYEFDRIDFSAHKETYRMLGLLLLAKVFHPAPKEVHLHLTHPSSEIRKLILDYDQTDGFVYLSGYETRPHQFQFWRLNWTERFFQNNPFDERKPWIWPVFSLTNEKRMVCSDEEWLNRDVVACAGESDYGNISFANLLLTLSLADETCNEVHLENEWHFGGVGPGSAEVCVLLPGSIGFSPDL